MIGLRQLYRQSSALSNLSDELQNSNRLRRLNFLGYQIPKVLFILLDKCNRIQLLPSNLGNVFNLKLESLSRRDDYLLIIDSIYDIAVHPELRVLLHWVFDWKPKNHLTLCLG